MDDPQGKAMLSQLLAVTFASQPDKFGEKAELSKYRDIGFQMKLEMFSIEQIRRAFDRFTDGNRTLPGPGDIKAIILGETKFIPDRAVYNRIRDEMKSETAFVTRKERQYVADYESHVLNEGRP